MYIYLSNESLTPVEVYFDDLKVTHTKSPVIQQDDYYPFGLTFNSYQRENSTINQFLYNGKEKQDELGLDWLDYGARMYDNLIGKWLAIDPLVDKFLDFSPYNYVFNNPIRLFDPDGMDPGDVLNKAKQYLGTNYEWGGKNPQGRLLGARDRLKDGSGTEKYHIGASIQLRSNWGLDTYSEVKSDVYFTFGVKSGTSFGVDCSGLVGQAFNSDPDKLMGNLVLGAAGDQMNSFINAELSGTGAIHNDFNLIGMGDIIFKLDEDNNVYHTMVATGDVKKDADGNVTRFKTIEATESGDKVRYKWRRVDDNQRIGHTFRTTDVVREGPVRDSKDRIRLSNFVQKYQWNSNEN